MAPIRFIHTADLHLGSPFTGISGLAAEQRKKFADTVYQAFDTLIDYAVREKPDFMLIAGDIYDGEDRTLRAQYKFQKGMERLNLAGIPVIISHGNHDHLGGGWARFELPGNVHVFDDQVASHSFTVSGNKVTVTGFSYGERHVKTAKILEFPQADESSDYHIGMLHGSMDGDASHAVYAPFKKEQLLSKNYHYWALGHIHLRQVLHEDPCIVYPGNIQGRHRKETGPKGFYDVRLENAGTSMEFIQTSAVCFDSLKISCSGILHMNELIDACIAEAEQYTSENNAVMAVLHLTDQDEHSAELLEGVPEAVLLEAIQEAIESSSAEAWISNIVVEDAYRENRVSAIGEKISATMSEWDLTDWKWVLKDLYQHPKASRYLDPLTNEAIEEIAADAIPKIHKAMRAGE
ncbi:metallophosphoesterase family protein [Planococcus halotolerans]|uniref:DNA repair exonuclease n=1 Tax=Planococcus halotolerans TaxID=2233542 RepID=A0A365KNL0_9BACL|nr:DNA repair exonuclease [Planococcus halotolerans]QHJ71916.1 DNA repair exonuclease [Planococcus halotolerans]RAZ74675.1 DNA repair exonuclease [Planococcus halotolerans]